MPGTVERPSPATEATLYDRFNGRAPEPRPRLRWSSVSAAVYQAEQNGRKRDEALEMQSRCLPAIYSVSCFRRDELLDARGSVVLPQPADWNTGPENDGP